EPHEEQRKEECRNKFDSHNLKNFPHYLIRGDRAVLRSGKEFGSGIGPNQKSSSIASSSERTPTMRMPSSFSRPFLFDSGRISFLKPSVCASCALVCACRTPRTSPVRPTSPKTAVSRGT